MLQYFFLCGRCEGRPFFESMRGDTSGKLSAQELKKNSFSLWVEIDGTFLHVHTKTKKVLVFPPSSGIK